MHYQQTVALKNGKTCVIRSAAPADAAEVCAVFNLTHAQTDHLLTYPDESPLTPETERDFLAQKADSPDETELCAVIDGRVVGTAGIEKVGSQEKLRHRAEFGIGIDKDYWGLGIGRALTLACIECAKTAGYAQLELDVLADNESALCLYKSVGFTEYGRNPRGFCSRTAGWQTLILMRMELC